MKSTKGGHAGIKINKGHQSREEGGGLQTTGLAHLLDEEATPDVRFGPENSIKLWIHTIRAVLH